MAAMKVPNYTEAQVTAMTEDYLAGKSVENIAAAMGKAVRSVRAKLVREGVYVAPVKAATVAKDEGPTKKELIRTLAELAPEMPVDGFMNATKEAIQAVIDRITPVND